MNSDKLIWITKVIRVNNLYSVYVDNSTSGILFNEDQVVKYKLVKDNSFHEDEWIKIVDSCSLYHIFDKTIKWINYRMRTEKETIEYLTNNGCDDELINDILNRLKELKYIDDYKYAQMYSLEKINSLIGPKVIEYNLCLKGIDDLIIKEVLENYSFEDYSLNALKVANKTLNTVIGEPILKQRETVYTRLSCMGYFQDCIEYCLNHIEYSNVDLDKIKKIYSILNEKGLSDFEIYSKLISKGYLKEDIKEALNK